MTFRFRDPTAARVQIKGEWYFERPSELPQLASTTSYTVQTPGLLPSEWQPGDVPIAYPNSTAANWPVIDMQKHGQGVWTYTTPLPSGVFSYGFFVDCTSPAQSGCTEISDPSNPPWNQSDGTVQGSVEPTSQVYVPSDPTFGTVDFTWQGPAREHGTLTDLTYNSPGPLQGKSIFVGAGWQDPIFAVGFGSSHTGPQHEVGIVTAASLPTTPDFINGGHEWYTWRILLKDFLTRVAFLAVPRAMTARFAARCRSRRPAG